MKRINIFVGHYGSGKTELAVNFAMKNKVDLIADLDTVNPYFRTNDARKILEDAGIRVVAPYYAGTNVDLPSLPPEVYAAFTEEKTAVLDIGGDDDGAAVLGRFKNYITEDNSEVYFVINVLRPETDTPDKIIEMIRAIEYTSRLKVTSLVNNTNLMEETTYDHVLKGEKIVKKVSEMTDIPFLGNAVKKELAKEKDFALDKYILML
ncbi:MAG: hypothetical protein Q4G23_11235 [Clostridia bacterium]|nr:hypothetical protein [Clostridia bacterium]